MRRERLVTDSAGVAWEVFREDSEGLGAVLEWGHRPSEGSPGLIFSSSEGLRRLIPAPDDWETLSDQRLLELLAIAATLY